MEITFECSEKDYEDFYLLQLKNHFVENWFRLILFPALFTYMAVSSGGNWWIAILTFLISAFIVMSIYYFVPHLINKKRLKKIIHPAVQQRTLTLLPEGLQLSDDKDNHFFNWGMTSMMQTNARYLYFTLVDKSIILVPKSAFRNDTEALNFLGACIAMKNSNYQYPYYPPKRVQKPPYALGFLCLIPVIGFITGIILIYQALAVYKNKWLLMIGTAGILVTVGFYAFMDYQTKFGKAFEEGFVNLSQMHLNSLITEIEFYKVGHGVYPDSLQQLRLDNKLINIHDPLLARNRDNNTVFNYAKISDTTYYLFSSGIDGQPFTTDDLYPVVPATQGGKIGWRVK